MNPDNPDAAMIQPLIFSFQGESCAIQFVKTTSRYKPTTCWHWLFQCPDGKQNSLTEQQVIDYLGISARTALYWRSGQHLNPASLYCLYLYGCKRMIPSALACKGFMVDGEIVKFKDKTISRDQIPDWDYLLWLLRQQRQDLEKLTKQQADRHQTAAPVPLDTYRQPLKLVVDPKG